MEFLIERLASQRIYETEVAETAFERLLEQALHKIALLKTQDDLPKTFWQLHIDMKEKFYRPLQEGRIKDLKEYLTGLVKSLDVDSHEINFFLVGEWWVFVAGGLSKNGEPPTETFSKFRLLIDACIMQDWKIEEGKG